LSQLIATDDEQGSEETAAGNVHVELLPEDDMPPPLWINTTEEAISAGIDVEAVLFELCFPKRVAIIIGNFI
jgi:hypothetical protein